MLPITPRRRTAPHRVSARCGAFLLEINVNDIDYTTEDLADALRDADLGRAYGEAYRLKIACMRDDRVSQESFVDLVSALEIILSRSARPCLTSPRSDTFNDL